MKRFVPAFLISAALGAAGGAGLKSLSGNTPAAAGDPPLSAGASSKEPPLGTPPAALARAVVAAPPKVPAMPRPGMEELRAALEADRLRLLIRWLPEAGAAEIAALAGEWFAENANVGSGNEVWQVLVQRWVEVDAAASLAHARLISRRWASHFKNGGNITTPLHYAYRALGRYNPELAFAFLAGETDPSFNSSSRRSSAGPGRKRPERGRSPCRTGRTWLI